MHEREALVTREGRRLALVSVLLKNAKKITTVLQAREATTFCGYFFL